MLKAQEALNISKNNEFDSLIQKVQPNIVDEIELFSPEVHISISYCESLFEAGIFSRLECERVKNALQTILKRAEFDRNYFDKTNSPNIYKFIDDKVTHLVGDLGLKIQIGRSFHDRNSTALRLWLREEITKISQFIHKTQELFVKLAENHKDQIFLTDIAGEKRQPILFSHWCLAHFEMLLHDRERLDEVWRRVNIMPLGANNGIGATLEFNREDLAAKLGFQGISVNSLEALRNQDFLIEFANVASILAIHISSTLKELLFYKHNSYFEFDIAIENENINLIHAQLKTISTLQMQMQNYLQIENLIFNKTFNGNTLAIIECVEILRISLSVLNLYLSSNTLNVNAINKDLENYLPNTFEIADYLVQRNEKVDQANLNAVKIYDLLRSNRTLANTSLSELQNISQNVEQDFFNELSLNNVINNKTQVGGTSLERVSEALEEAKQALQYEE